MDLVCLPIDPEEIVHAPLWQRKPDMETDVFLQFALLSFAFTTWRTLRKKDVRAGYTCY